VEEQRERRQTGKAQGYVQSREKKRKEKKKRTNNALNHVYGSCGLYSIQKRILYKKPRKGKQVMPNSVDCNKEKESAIDCCM
jgi:hypothetical protein